MAIIIIRKPAAHVISVRMLGIGKYNSFFNAIEMQQDKPLVAGFHTKAFAEPKRHALSQKSRVKHTPSPHILLFKVIQVQ